MRLLTNHPRDIQRAIREPRDQPLGLKSYADPTALPNAADWLGGLVHVGSINTVVFSDGIAWYPLDKGAAL